jgi:hypothetical protein
LKDRNGLLDLEHSICDNWDATTAFAAIRDFEELCRVWGDNRSFFHPIRFSHYKKFGDEYRRAVEHFLDSITTFQYLTSGYMTDIKRNIFVQYWNLFSRTKLGKSLRFQEFGTASSFSSISKKDYLEAARILLNSIFDVEHHSSDLIVLNHPLPPFKLDRAQDYFGKDVKAIVVDRDPRDILCEWIKYKSEIGFDISRKMDIDKFCEWHKAKRRKRIESSQVLYVSYEKLICGEEEEQKIKKFLNLNESDHTRKGCCLIKSESEKNINQWKTNKTIGQDVFMQIYERLLDI